MSQTLPPRAQLGTTRPQRRSGETVEWARFVASTAVEGPGDRSALWVQGCSVRCPGCFNPQLWASHGGTIDTTDAAAREWARQSIAAGVEGVTLLGGEPFDQAEACAAIAEEYQRAGLTVMTFSGYRLLHLQAWAAERDDIARLLAATDLLADGPYLRDRPDHRRPWIGSTNQGLTALSGAYADTVRGIEAGGGGDGLEVRITASGTVEVNGWADDATLEALLGDLGTRIDRPGPRRDRGAARPDPTPPDTTQKEVLP